jgi:molecular chaperone GrpE
MQVKQDSDRVETLAQSPHSIEDEAVATEAVDMATLMAENASLRDRLLRALAESENTRRRADRQAEDARNFAIADFARELLVVIDNLQRTIEAADEQTPSTADNAVLLEGVRATLRVFMKTLERFGVRRIEALGQPFDPNLHEAIMEVEDPSQPPGTVIRVVEPGYTINDRLLRPARVLIAKRRDGARPAADAEESDPALSFHSRGHSR